MIGVKTDDCEAHSRGVFAWNSVDNGMPEASTENGIAADHKATSDKSSYNTSSIMQFWLERGAAALYYDVRSEATSL